MTASRGGKAEPPPAAAGEPALHVGTVWMLDLNDPAEIEFPAIHPLIEATFRRVGPEDLPVISAAAIEASAADDAKASAAIEASAAAAIKAEILRRFESGKRCYGAWVGENLAAYGWVSFTEEFVGELGLSLRFTPCEAYIWDCATLPAYRQKRLYSALLVSILQALQAEDICRAWIGADTSNQPSQRGIDRAGFHRVADLVAVGTAEKFTLKTEGYPGVPGALVAEAERAFLGI